MPVSPKEQIVVYLDHTLREQLDASYKRLGFKSRNEAINEAVRRLLKEDNRGVEVQPATGD